ncbi:Hsp20/alpha crystallin family protein [Ruicaihuangia caeni]|uniref:Hsp20/alpha crystallin family protein n=1 Tax=Ruicaihuangia caeni TaxID=3042517 RepID=UPI00338DEA91
MARNIVRYNPFAELDALQRQFFGDDFFTAVRGSNIPTTDVYMDGDRRLVVEAHLPNFGPDDINIDLDEGALVIQAEKREHEEDKSKKYMVRESSSSFYRRIMLPERADQGSIDAHFENGVLKVTVPFKELPTPRKISITSGASAGSSGSTDTAQGTGGSSGYNSGSMPAGAPGDADEPQSNMGGA